MMYEKDATETLGQYIARLRKEKGYSQRKLALLSGISNTTINRIESGETPNPDAPTLKALAVVLELEETTLLIAAGYINVNSTSINIPSPAKAEEDLMPKDIRQIEKDLEKMMTDIQVSPKEGFSSFDGNTDMSEEDLELFEDALRTALKIAKRLNKKTYGAKTSQWWWYNK